MRTALITGISGQDGSYLAQLLLEQGYRVVGLTRAGSTPNPERIAGIRAAVELVQVDLLDEQALREVISRHCPDEIYNLAARASSSHLFAEPVLTAEFNAIAVLKLLEAIRAVNPAIRFCQASSSEMYGHPTESPQSETTVFAPRNPYGVAKLFAHGMVGVYREVHGMFACSSILFNHESPRRGPEFVTRKITMGVARIKAGLSDSLQLGSLDATRDWGYASDYVYAMWRMLSVDTPADYVLATGESHSVREFCDIAFRHVGLDYSRYVLLDPQAQRLPEPLPRVGNPARARAVLGWRPTVTFEQLVRMMVDADLERVAGIAGPQPT